MEGIDIDANHSVQVPWNEQANNFGCAVVSSDFIPRGTLIMVANRCAIFRIFFSQQWFDIY